MIWLFVTIMTIVVILLAVAKFHQTKRTKEFHRLSEVYSKPLAQFGISGVIKESHIDKNGIRVITDMDIHSVSVLPPKTLH